MIIYFKEHKKIFFLLLAITFLYYGNSLKNKYALDDDYVTVTNFPIKGKEKEYVPNQSIVAKGFKGIPKIWKSRYAHDGENSFDYRPVTTTSFAIEYAIFGQSPFISHLINTIVYFFSVWLVFCILMKLLDNYENKVTIAFICSLLFLIHPIHTEVVNNIKCRDELLAFTFGMLSFWYCLKIYQKITLKDILLIVLFLILGLLSKRSALLFIGIVPLSFFFYRNLNLKHLYILISALFLTFLVTFLIKLNIVSEGIKRTFYHFENPLYIITVPIFQKIIIAIKCLGFYTKLFIFPYPLRFYYGGNSIDFSSSLDLNFFIGILYILLSIYLIVKYKNKLFIFATLLYLGCIFPFLNFMSPAPGVLAERFVFSASLGFCLIVTIGLLVFLKKFSFQSYAQLFSKPFIYITLIVVVSMVYTWNRNSNWHNKVVLFEHDIPYLTNSAKANSLLANEYFEMLHSPNKKYSQQIIIQKALKHYSLAVTSDSSIYSAYNNAGVVYYSFLSDIPKAKKLFKLATIHKERYAQAYENLGNCYKIEKDTNQAFQSYKMAIIYGNQNFSSYLGLINMLFEFKQYQKALNVIKIANSYFPNNYDLTAQEANCYFMRGDTATALNKYEQAYNLNSNHELAQFLSQKYKIYRNIEKSEFYGSK